MEKRRMKIVVDRMPQSPKECFYLTVLNQKNLRVGALPVILIGLRNYVASAAGKSVRILQKPGGKTRWVTADICQECKDKLREYIAKAVDIKEIECVGESIHWLNEKGEKDG